MSAVTVPRLAAKLKLLVEAGGAPSMEALAARLGRKPATLRWWINGDAARAPDTVPVESWQKLVALTSEALPRHDPAQLRTLLQGPVEDLEAQLNLTGIPSLMDLIEREGVSEGVQIIGADGASLGLVTTSRTPDRPARATLRLGQLFRITAPTRLPGRFTLGLQRAPSGWGLVPSAVRKGLLHMPDLDDAGEPLLMREDSDPGRHLFVIAQSDQPFPAVLTAALRDGLPLDRTLASAFVRHYARLPRQRWQMAIVALGVLPIPRDS